MFKKLALAIVLLFIFYVSAFAEGLTTFHSEKTAQHHCPKDIVLWLNLPTGIWHYKGQRWYGRTKRGAYVCEREAETEGDRGTLNGQ